MKDLFKILRNIVENQRGMATLYLVMIILAASLAITLAVNEIMRHGVTFSWQQIHSTKAYFAAEGGIEQILYALRNRRVNFSSCSTNECVRFVDDNVATTTDSNLIDCGGGCGDGDKFKTFSNGAEFYLSFSSSTADNIATNTVISYGNFMGSINRAVAVRWYERTCVGPECNATAATSCVAILNNGDSIGDGYYYINPLGQGSAEVWCDMTGGGWIELSPINGPHGDGFYLCSADPITNATACGFPPGPSWVRNGAITDSTGYVVGDTNDVCAPNPFDHTWQYNSGPGNPLTSEEVYWISRVIASDGNIEKSFNLMSDSCDDQNRGYPPPPPNSGNWNGFFNYSNSNMDVFDWWGANNLYCTPPIANAVVTQGTFETWPLPLRVCCSTNILGGSEGGTIMGFMDIATGLSTVNLKVR